MKTLAFDTSTKFLSIALLEDENVIAEFHEDVGIKHSELLMPTIRDLVAGAGWNAKDIGLIAAGTGPGSFTGLRIAAATVKGLAVVIGSKVIGVPTMDAMIMNFPKDKGTRAAPLLDARKGKVYSCVYNLSGGEPERITDYLIVTIEAMLDKIGKKTVFFGDAVEKYRDKLTSHPLADCAEDLNWYPRASWIGKIGFKRSKNGTDDPETFEPMYLHEKECNVSP